MSRTNFNFSKRQKLQGEPVQFIEESKFSIGAVYSLFMPDSGDAIFHIHLTNYNLYKNTLPKPFDLSSSITSTSGSLSPTTFQTSLFFKPDGTRFFYGTDAQKRIYSWDLATPWDVTTRTGTRKNSPMTFPFIHGLYFSQDGLNCVIADGSNGIRKCELSTAWDITKINSGTIIYNAPDYLDGISFYDSGKKFIYSTRDGAKLELFEVSNPYDFTTIVKSYTFTDAVNFASGGLGMSATSDGKKIISGRGTSKIVLLNNNF
ncbi:hypothetical protein JM79_3219 [Gramella sp. Hel_I_59]|uniref:hypothetical protein n=1 Tax=Gramella sp. Hel_I_59 TaxID=1249978 RepID=UPI00115181BF|nr:hypothetical protein [Gramella sp. Hel_I_59]TQI72262.1 hypothetical protein JM79_3219 [Gramella sp. Hel_I_59]